MIFIGGFHRSGTTILTKLLASHPMLNVGRAPEITWENLSFYEMNRTILRECKGSWREPPPEMELQAYHNKEIKNALDRLRGNGVNLLKDPRFCLTAPLWLEAADQLSIEVSIIIIMRNPMDCVRSLGRLYGVDMEEGLRLFERYYISLLDSVKDRAIQIVLFEILMQRPYYVMKPICDRMGIDAGLLQYGLVESKNWRHRAGPHKGDYHIDVRKHSS